MAAHQDEGLAWLSGHLRACVFVREFVCVCARDVLVT